MEQTLAATCFLLTKAVLGHETALQSASHVDPSAGDYATHQAYQRYRMDPRSQQTAPQRISAALNSAFGVEVVSPPVIAPSWKNGTLGGTYGTSTVQLYCGALP